MQRPEPLAFPPTRLVTTSMELAELCARLATDSFVTVDTEFMRERTYWPELCVVQLGGTQDVAVVDAQAEGGTGDTQTLPVDAPPLCLHAWKLSLKHPLSGHMMTFEAPRPSWAC
jgi:hypothetical protein